jgi:hypothetical protein
MADYQERTVSCGQIKMKASSLGAHWSAGRTPDTECMRQSQRNSWLRRKLTSKPSDGPQADGLGPFRIPPVALSTARLWRRGDVVFGPHAA